MTHQDQTRREETPYHRQPQGHVQGTCNLNPPIPKARSSKTIRNQNTHPMSEEFHPPIGHRQDRRSNPIQNQPQTNPDLIYTATTGRIKHYRDIRRKISREVNQVIQTMSTAMQAIKDLSSKDRSIISRITWYNSSLDQCSIILQDDLDTSTDSDSSSSSQEESSREQFPRFQRNHPRNPNLEQTKGRDSHSTHRRSAWAVTSANSPFKPPRPSARVRSPTPISFSNPRHQHGNTINRFSNQININMHKDRTSKTQEQLDCSPPRIPCEQWVNSPYYIPHKEQHISVTNWDSHQQPLPTAPSPEQSQRTNSPPYRQLQQELTEMREQESSSTSTWTKKPSNSNEDNVSGDQSPLKTTRRRKSTNDLSQAISLMEDTYRRMALTSSWRNLVVDDDPDLDIGHQQGNSQRH